MSTSTLGLFLRHLALSEEVSRLGTVSDHDLLAVYEPGRGQAAFTELMRRHGPMVLRTCRRVLGRETDAEDAFQVTFVLLARQAGSISKRESLSSWLHQVAYRTALNVLRSEVRRRTHERQDRVMSHHEGDPVTKATWNEIQPILDAELDALPDEARRLLIAFYLEEKTYTEVAAELGLPRGSLVRRLEQARTLLASRLARRGITVSALLLAILLEDSAKGAGVPAVLLVHTVEAARTFSQQTTGIVSENVVRLVKGGLAHMTRGWTYWRMALAGWLSLLGAGLIACQTLKAWPDQKPEPEPSATAAERPTQEREKQARTDRYGDPLPHGALTRLGTMRLRHNTYVQSLAFTPDGKGLLTAGGDNLPRLWDVATGKLRREFHNIPKPQFIGDQHYRISATILSPDGRLLAVRSGQMGSLYLLETATGKRLHEFKDETEHLRTVPSVDFAFSPDSKAIAAQLDDRLQLRDVATGKTLWVLEEKEKDFVGLAFSPDGKTLASVSRSGGIRLWDARTGEPLRAFGPQGNIDSIAFSPDGRTLALDYRTRHDGQGGHDEHRVCLWDVSTDKEVRRLGEPGESVYCPVFSPDSRIVTTCDGREIYLWEVATGKKLHRCQNTHSHGSPVAFSPDGKMLASLDGPVVRFWEVASGKALPSRLPTGHEGDVKSVAFTPDGQTLISTGGDQTLRWWDTWTGQQRLCLLCMKNHFRLYDGFPKAALSPDGTTLATTCVDVSDEGTPAKDKKRLRGSIRLWDAATGKELGRLDSGNGTATALVFSPDGKRLAEGFWPQGSRFSVVRLWDVASGKRSEHELAGTCPVFSSDGNILATIGSLGPRRAIRFWKVATGEKIHAVSTNENIRCLAFSPDGKMLATGSDKIILYSLSWDKQSGVQVGPPRLASFPCGIITALAFSPDSRMLASNGSDLAIHLWETASGKERARFQEHAATALNTYVESLTFSADGRRLASGSVDSTILLWDVTSRLRDGALRPAKLSEKELEDRWAGLASNDAARAGRVIWSLVAAGPQAISLLGERLRPAIAKVSPEIVARLITDLDAENFQTRQKARRELATLGEVCEPALRRALAKRPSLELRRSLQELLSQLEEERKGSPSGDVLRGARAVEVLEQIGTPEAQQVLKTLAKGAPLARLTHEAQAALQRIDWRMARRPTRAD